MPLAGSSAVANGGGVFDTAEIGNLPLQLLDEGSTGNPGGFQRLQNQFFLVAPITGRCPGNGIGIRRRE
jgi:hypothetical protein